MLRQVDKFWAVCLIVLAALRIGHDGFEAALDGNWIWVIVCLISCAYTVWLAITLITHFFPEKCDKAGLPVK